MKKIELLKTFHHSLITGLIFGGIILAYLLLIIHPYEKTRTQLDDEIDDLKAQVKEQQVLAPILMDILKRTKIQVPEGLSFPEKTKIARDDTDKIPMVFQDIAQMSNLNLKRFKLDLKSFANDSGLLEVNIVLNGRLFHFQSFLKRLYEVSYVGNIERIIIRTVQGEKDPEFELNVSLARE